MADQKHHSKGNSKRPDLENTAAMQKVYNVISLECTETELAKLVRPPRLVKEIDWVDNCWPESKKKRKSAHAHIDPRGTLHTDDLTDSAAPTFDQRPDALGDDSVAGKRKLDGDGWPKVKLYCLMGKAGSWTVSAPYVLIMAID